MSNLSEAQKGLLMVEYFYPNSSATTVGLYLNLGVRDITEVDAAVKAFMNVHDCFRMKLRKTGDTVQRYYDEYVASTCIHYCDELEIKACIDQKAGMSFFNWDKHLYEIDIYQSSNDEVHLSFFANHMITDGLGMHLFVKGVLELIVTGECQKPLLTLDECIQEEHEYSLSVRSKRNKIFWQEKIRNYNGFDLFDMKQVNIDRLETGNYLGELGGELTKRVMSFCEENGVSLAQLFNGVLLIYKSKMTNSRSVSIGTILHGRSNRKKRTILSTFIRSLFLIVNIDYELNVLDYLEMIKIETSQLVRNYKISCGDLMECIEDVSGLDDISLSVQINESLRKRYTDTDGAWIKPKEKIKPLTIHIKEELNSDSICLDYEFLLSILDEDVAVGMHERIKQILMQFISRPSMLIKDISFLSDKEYELIVNGFNDTHNEYPREKTVIQLFEEQVAKTPDHIAVVFEEESITYHELNKKANVLAHRLRELGVKPDDYVAIMADRSIEMIIGIYGIIKAGGAYVPIDLMYPSDRIQYILEDCSPKVVLRYKAEVETKAPVIDLGESDNWQTVFENPVKVNKPKNLIYCIYTSGTTGKPKGVLVEHLSVVNLRQSYIDDIGLSEKDVLLQFASICFDQSVGDILVGLTIGATLCVASDDTRRDPQAIEFYINKHSVTFASLTPKIIQELNPVALPSLKLLDCGGEAGSLYELKKWSLYCRVFNTYGPTEGTVNASVMEIRAKTEKLTIGHPILNTQIYIVSSGQLCGIGMSGELCITGDSLARGYLNQTELTKEKFIDNPYGGATRFSISA